MGNINFQCDKSDYVIFKTHVGNGNVSAALRNFIKSYAGKKDTYSDQKTIKLYEIKNIEYQKIRSEWLKLKSKVEEIEMIRKQGELDKIKKEEKIKEKMSNLQENYIKANLWREG